MCPGPYPALVFRLDQPPKPFRDTGACCQLVFLRPTLWKLLGKEVRGQTPELLPTALPCFSARCWSAFNQRKTARLQRVAECRICLFVLPEKTPKGSEDTNNSPRPHWDPA